MCSDDCLEVCAGSLTIGAAGSARVVAAYRAEVQFQAKAMVVTKTVSVTFVIQRFMACTQASLMRVGMAVVLASS